MGKKRKDSDIIVTLIGGQSDGVTGSSTLISYVNENGDRKLIQCEMGMIQGNNTLLGEYRENKKMLEKIPCESIDYSFMIHEHCDHIGMMPYLIANGFNGRIITTYVQKEISKCLLLDASYIHQKSCFTLKSKGHRDVKPLYTDQDTYRLFDFMEVFSIGEMHKLDDSVSFRYLHNSHVVGATQLELYIKKQNGQVKKILITSDLGSRVNKQFTPFLKETEIVPKANLVLMESTYGGRDSFSKQDCIKERREIKRLVQEYVLDNKNRVMIPCFSFQRLQTQMCLMYEMFKDNWDYEIPIVVDTKLGNQINDIFSRVLEGEDLEYWEKVKSWKAFKFIKNYKGTMAFLAKRTPCVVLSSSGMISAGHSVIYAESFLDSKNDCMIFCGYCSPNTIGGKILDDTQNTVTIEKIPHQKRCRIVRFNTFSSHAQEDDLIDYMKQINCDKIILHHGDKTAKASLKERGDRELREVDKTTPIVCSEKGMQIVL